MALYLDGHDYALFGSPDLKTWRQLDSLTLGEATECPDIFKLPVDGNPADSRWLFWGADGSYVLGDFDGETFTPKGRSTATIGAAMRTRPRPGATSRTMTGGESRLRGCVWIYRACLSTSR